MWMKHFDNFFESKERKGRRTNRIQPYRVGLHLTTTKCIYYVIILRKIIVMKIQKTINDRLS